jgi:hypothetical protein
MEVSTGSATVVGFSFYNSEIAAGSGVLTVLSFSSVTDGITELSLGNFGAVTDASGNVYTTTTSGSIDHGDADCLGNYYGDALLDNCGTCDNDTSNDCVADCSGIWGGSSVKDECDICGGGGSCDCIEDGSKSCDCCCPEEQERDCAGECDGSAAIDLCNVCNGGNICLDCAGTPNGDAVTDNCGTCDADIENDCVQDCVGVWGGEAEIDICGVCNGDNDCEGVDCTDTTSDYCNDLSVLQIFIDNSQGGENPPPSDMYTIGLGQQTWVDGRLVAPTQLYTYLMVVDFLLLVSYL